MSQYRYRLLLSILEFIIMGATCMIIMPFSQIFYQWRVVDF